jgi:hypothetical protein
MSEGTKDLIDRYTEIVMEYVDAPKIFIEASACWLVSSLLGRFFKCPWLPPLSRRPDLWFLLESIPGATRRSTIQFLAKYVYRNAYLRYLTEWERTNKDEAKAIVEQSIIEEGTPEGIMDHIEASNLDAYVIMSSEFGGVLKRAQNREYMSGVLSLFSKMFYGEGGSMYLSQRGGKAGMRRLPEGLYVTMLAGMQELKEYITREAIRQGFLRRVIICHVDTRKHDRWLPPIREEYELVLKSLDQLAEELKNRMIELSKVRKEREERGLEPKGFIPVYFFPQVESKIIAFSYELDMAVRKDPNDINIYKQSLWEHLAKLAIVRAISRGKLDEIRKGDLVVNVREEDYVKARAFLDEVMKAIDEVILSLGEREKAVPTVETALDKIKRLLAEAGGEMERQHLLRKMKISAKEFDEYISTLVQRGEVTWSYGPSTGGRRPIIYKLVE